MLRHVQIICSIIFHLPLCFSKSNPLMRMQGDSERTSGTSSHNSHWKSKHDSDIARSVNYQIKNNDDNLTFLWNTFENVKN